MAKTNAQKQRAMRQEALRKWLSNKGLLEKVVDTVEEIDRLACQKIEDFESLDDYVSVVSTAKDKVQILKVGIDARLKMVNKYLPDMTHSAIEADSEDGKFSIVIQSYANKPAE